MLFAWLVGWLPWLLAFPAVAQHGGLFLLDSFIFLSLVIGFPLQKRLDPAEFSLVHRGNLPRRRDIGGLVRACMISCRKVALA